MAKKRIAIFGATGCRTCERTILDINYQVSAFTAFAEIAFWPYMLGSMMEDLESCEGLDVCFFSGCVSTAEEAVVARKLRDRSRVMVACGACAAFGGMPGLRNLRRAQQGVSDSASSSGGAGIPTPGTQRRVSSLSQVAPVDYVIPGCPPTANLVWVALQAFLCGPSSRTNFSYAASRLPEAVALAVTSGIMPPKGSIFAGEKAVCASCSRMKVEKRFETVKRPYEDYMSTGDCLLEQGLVCQGIATQEGCGGLCTGVGIPCRGCFGKVPAAFDPGAKMVSAISSTFDTADPTQVTRIVDKFEDLTGAFYRYTLPSQCSLYAASGRDNDADSNH